MTEDRIAELEQAIGKRRCACPECALARELLEAVLEAHRPRPRRRLWRRTR